MMPLRVTDQTYWRLSATVGVGHASTPELLNGTCRCRPHITSERNDLEHPPQRHVRKKLDSDFDRRAVLQLEWIALGLTAKCFWTAPHRLNARLESQARFPLNSARLD